jgi:hypothetical protein
LKRLQAGESRIDRTAHRKSSSRRLARSCFSKRTTGEAACTPFFQRAANSLLKKAVG